MEYPRVAELFRVIDSYTWTVVIDPELIDALRHGERVGYRKLLLHSVQIWRDKAAKLPIVPICSSRAIKDDSSTLYTWEVAYDSDFLGYMAGAIPLLEGLRDGCFLA
jgi:hypothetical protein